MEGYIVGMTEVDEVGLSVGCNDDANVGFIVGRVVTNRDDDVGADV